MTSKLACWAGGVTPIMPMIRTGMAASRDDAGYDAAPDPGLASARFAASAIARRSRGQGRMLLRAPAGYEAEVLLSSLERVQKFQQGPEAVTCPRDTAGTTPCLGVAAALDSGAS